MNFSPFTGLQLLGGSGGGSLNETSLQSASHASYSTSGPTGFARNERNSVCLLKITSN